MFEFSQQSMQLQERVDAFMQEHVFPAQDEVTELIRNRTGADRWKKIPKIEELKPLAKEAGLWNMFLPHKPWGAGLSNLDYAPLAELMGRVGWSSQVFNCSAPDTGNMEVLTVYGSPEQQKQYLEPLLEGEIRSAFAMTEPHVASSDATNISCQAVRDGDEWVLNGEKWWTSGAGDEACKVMIVMCCTNPDAPKHQRQSQILVPMDTKGVEVVRMMEVFGWDDSPHGHAHIKFNNVRVPYDNILLGEGRGFEIAQGRLGPGRIHHCMRSIGVAEQALSLMVKRANSRTAFGKPIIELGANYDHIAHSRTEIDMARLLTLNAAKRMDDVGNKVAKKEIAEIKVAAPNMALRVIDRAIQMHGAAGVSQDTPLAFLYAHQRTLRIADGPDEVHLRTIARLEIKDQEANS